MRLGPKFQQLQDNFEQRRLQLQAEAPGEDPELVVVFETIGSVDKFLGAVQKVAGLEWLLESEEPGILPDDDFHNLDEEGDREERPLSGTLFLLGTNRQALNEVIALWGRYRDDPNVTLERGLGKWKDVFKHLRDVRFWSSQDRIDADVRAYWQNRIDSGDQRIRFEIEAWCFRSPEKNDSSAVEIRRLTEELGGQLLHSALMESIAYHGFLVEMPAEGVQRLISEGAPGLVLSERVMFFRPQGQGLASRDDTTDRLPGTIDRAAPLPQGRPIAALLDGLPLQNHPLLQGRLAVEDPDDWEPTYEAADRVHGTAMASLIVHGELDGNAAPLDTPLYVRPILRPDPNDPDRPRREATPNDRLLIDLFHRAVRRIFEGEGNSPAAAPSVKVINVSVGDAFRPFDTVLSPWARLIDWLAHRYNVLFIVSAGNVDSSLTLDLPRDSIGNLADADRRALVFAKSLQDTAGRRLLSPAEGMNVLTVGALHSDSSTPLVLQTRYDAVPERSVSVYSCVGHGYRRAIKPDILLPGGRVLFRELPGGPQNRTTLKTVNGAAAPGHRVAAPPIQSGENTKYCRGTSNSAALATRWATQAYAVVASLRTGREEQIPAHFDALLLRALLAHGARWGELGSTIEHARADITTWQKRQDFVTRMIGYGSADVARALQCTEQRATLLGVAEVEAGQAIEFRAPLPPCLIAQTAARRLTITLAWFSPTNARHAKYRSARLWIEPPHNTFGVQRRDCNWRNVTRGTLQHEVLEGNTALAFVDGDSLLFKVNCRADMGRLEHPVRFALCVSIEVAEGVNLPIYQQIRDRIQPQVGVMP
ncbi:S8 family peptidase [Ralstonia pseudosolanacearum]|uniref:S8 family peptidase n=1 Tax=Ralstonia pseudosolanacearum TaxID=1310165 RepID=UPI0020064491|nr:S8 family peptidase [Ralstonia pseudosolanacearum]